MFTFLRMVCCVALLGGAEVRGDGAEAELGVAEISEGFDWLMGQQGADGGWHSETYGAMRGGAGLTSLVLYSASLLPEEVVEPHLGALRRGWAFLAPGVRGTGKVSAPDGETDFPTYASAHLLCAFNRMELGETPEDIGALVLFLERVQLGEKDGFAAESPDFGGWDMMGDVRREGRTTGTSVSVSRFVIEALVPHRKNHDGVASSMRRAEDWIGGLQNLDTDGGFYFHPEGEHLGNKAGWMDRDDKAPRSYGTCTADGLVALAYLAAGSEGAKGFPARMKAAAGWIEKQPEVNSVPGFDFDPPESGWEEGLRYYYMNALSAAIPLISDSVATERSRKLAEVLVSEQSKAGFWKNESARMREDDPIIATCFALAALGRLAER